MQNSRMQATWRLPNLCLESDYQHAAANLYSANLVPDLGITWSRRTLTGPVLKIWYEQKNV